MLVGIQMEQPFVHHVLFGTERVKEPVFLDIVKSEIDMVNSGIYIV